ICKKIIFHQSDINKYFLLCALRLLYICPMCFHHLQENEFQILREKLIDWAINEEEPICSHAISILIMIVKIECLQVIAYLSFKKGTKVKVIIDRLLAMMDILDEISLVSIQTLSYTKLDTFNEHPDVDKLCIFILLTSDETLNEKKFGKTFLELNICNYIDIKKISNFSSQKFHHMALLSYIVLYIDIDELIERTNLIELVNILIIRKESNFLALRCLALSIICNFANNEKFMRKIVEKKCLVGIFAIPYNFSTNVPFSIILQKIVKNDSFLEYLTVNHPNVVIWILQYAIKMYSVSNNSTIHEFLLNLVIKPPFSEIFHNMKGITLILDEIKKRSWYISLISDPFDIKIPKDFYDMNRVNVRFAAKIIFDYSFTFVRSITPSNILNSIHTDKV
ncbi:hypothetical protein MXB_4045, partial [Myxobolus squamalis]